MSVHKTYVFEDFILNHARNGTAWTQPTSLEVALFTAVANINTGSVTEVPTAGGHYARQALTLGVPAVGVAGMRSGNTSTITFPQNTSGASIGDVTHWGIYDNSGNLLIIVPFGADSFTYADDFQPEFAVDALGVELQGMTHYLGELVLNHLRNGTAWSQPATLTARLYTAVSDRYGGVATEVAVTGYSAPVITFGAPVNGTNGRQMSNDAVETFGENTSGDVTVSDYGVHDGTNLLWLFAYGSTWNYGLGSDPEHAIGTFVIEER